MSLPHGLGEGDEGWSPSPAICFKAHSPRPLEPPGDKDSSTGQLVPPQPQVPPELEGVGAGSQSPAEKMASGEQDMADMHSGRGHSPRERGGPDTCQFL